jgi:hypothetical protein
MREFKPKQVYEVVQKGDKWEKYYHYLAEYIISYFEELKQEIEGEVK